jgi:hypothetical protein
VGGVPWHTPFVHPLLCPAQLLQVFPLVPQALLAVPGSHCPLLLQQPLQFVESHFGGVPWQAPLTHAKPKSPQGRHLTPALPQAFVSLPARHVPAASQQPLQF